MDIKIGDLSVMDGGLTTIDVNKLVRAKLVEIAKRLATATGLIVAGAGVGGPVGWAVKEASTIEKVVEKVIKVPVPAPAPDLKPFPVDCWRCGAHMVITPPRTGQVGATVNESDTPR